VLVLLGLGKHIDDPGRCVGVIQDSYGANLPSGNISRDEVPICQAALGAGLFANSQCRYDRE
jgi:hypothetical protein